MRKYIDSITTLSHAISDPNRIRLLVACLDRERCVCQLVELVDLSNASISKHLTVLKSAGLLQARRDGRWMHYSIPDSTTSIVQDTLDFITRHALLDESILEDRIKLNKIEQIEPAELARMQREGCCINLDCCRPTTQSPTHSEEKEHAHEVQ